MPYTINTFWTNKLATFPNVKHCYYKLIDVNQIPDVPGLYSWHLWIDSNNTDKYSQVFKHKKAKLSVEFNLTERFKGTVKNDGHSIDIFDPATDIGICNIASVAMCPPLYIGISNKLGSRLLQHSDELGKIIGGTKPTPISTIGRMQFDTIVESAHFAERIGYVISTLGNLNSNNLLIKTIELPSGYPKSQLQTIEKFLNRTFIPIYGRK